MCGYSGWLALTTEKVGHAVLTVLISSMLLLAIVENQNLYALTSGDRFSHGEQQAAIDFQNNIPFNPVCVAHTSYYCAGYFNVTWNNLSANGQTSNPSPNQSASNSTNLPITSNTNTIAADSHEY
ncbi:MAG: hypothetical protein WBZ36_12145 [Candidatus Nitrosopolaris sp.]